MKPRGVLIAEFTFVGDVCSAQRHLEPEDLRILTRSSKYAAAWQRHGKMKYHEDEQYSLDGHYDSLKKI